LQTNATTEYFLGDALGSGRQLTDQRSAITLSKTYDPYSVVSMTSGSSQTSYGYTGEYTGDYNGLVYLRARYYAPINGRFISRDTWVGDAKNPITYDKWVYASANPVYYMDPSGEFPIPILLLLIALGIISSTSGCTTGPEPIVCPPLPANLQPDSLSKNPREQSLQNIKDYFGIQLPPPVTYVDINHQSHSTSYKFVYSPSTGPHGGYTPWFTNRLEGSWGSKWGDLIIFETSFTHPLEFNAYDIAAAMVHEATHAWQQYTLVQLAQAPQSRFMQNLENHSYYTSEWGEDYQPAREFEASSYVLQHYPTPLCMSSYARDNEQDYLNKNFHFKHIVGLELSPWPMPGYPLP